MEFIRSLQQLAWGVVKRLYWLVPSLFTDPFDLLERWFGMNYQPAEWLFWLLLSFGLLIAIALTYHELRMQTAKLAQERKVKSSITSQLEKRLTGDDQIALMNLNRQMNALHGHDDYFAIRADYKSGIDMNDILKRDCTRCGRPRNKRGKHL